MTESAAPIAPAAAAKNPDASAKAWAYYPLALGAFGFVVAFIVVLIPPAHTSTAAGEIVNFPSMFGQYAIAILVGLLSAVLLLVGLIANLLRSRG